MENSARMDIRPKEGEREEEKMEEAGEEGREENVLPEGFTKVPVANRLSEETTKVATTDGGSSELKTVDVYVLLLGDDCRDFKQYVEIVITAKECLSKTGYNVVGAFMSVKVLDLAKPSENMSSDLEYIKMLEACKNLSPELAGWVKIAPASIVARDSSEFTDKLHKMLRTVTNMTNALCFRLLDFDARMQIPD